MELNSESSNHKTSLFFEISFLYFLVLVKMAGWKLIFHEKNGNILLFYSSLPAFLTD